MGSEPRTERSEPGARERRRIGPYRITRRLAIGGMSEVFLAESSPEPPPSQAGPSGHAVSVGSRVVLKLPLPDAGRAGVDSPPRGGATAMDHEAELLARLVHPNVVRTFGCIPIDDGDGDGDGDGNGNGARALVLEYVDGPSLDLLLAAMAPSTPTAPTSLRIVLDVLSALEAAHGATDANGLPLGLVHRDVNPRNVLLTRDGVVKLADFGIARSRLARARTRTGAIRGTLRYLAPEQATGSDVDARTDLYAVGLLAFELLAGEPYARGSSELELIREAENPVTRELPADVAVGSEVRAAIATALRRFAEQRPASAAAFAAKLARFAAPPDAARAELASLVARFTPPDPRDAHAPDASTPMPNPGPGHAARPGAPEPRAGTRVTRAAAAAVAAGLGVALLAVAFAAAVATPGNEPPERTSTPSTRTRVAEEPSEAPASLVAVAEGRVAASPPVAEGERARPSGTSPSSAPSSERPLAPDLRPTRVSGTTSPASSGTPPPAEVAAIRPVPVPVPDLPDVPDVAESRPLGRDEVRRELARTNDAIRLARERGDDVAEAQALSRAALEAYAEDRYADASVILARIRGLVTRSE